MPKKQPRRSAKPKAKRQKRKDDNKKGVIISQKRDKKIGAFLTQKVPFPFQSAKHYEDYNRNPLGKEWNTGNMYAKLNRPTVEVKDGLFVQPLRRQDLVDET